jgi:hypothetical protein
MRRRSSGLRVPVFAPLPFPFKYLAKFLPKFGGAAPCPIHIRPLQATGTAPNRAVIQFPKHPWKLQLRYVIRITTIHILHIYTGAAGPVFL